MPKKLSRRAFMDRASRAAVGAGVLLGTSSALGGDKAAKSRLVEVQHAKAVTAERKVDAAAVRQMVRRGMQKLTGKSAPFQHLFKPTDRVGLKINCLGRPLIYTHHEVVQAFCAELEAAGVKPGNIVVWDRFDRHLTDCGFKLADDPKAVRVLASETYADGPGRLNPNVTYASGKDNPDGREDGGDKSRLSHIFTSDVDKVINLAILKDHALAGVTLCLKNIAFGLCDNNRRFHRREHIGPFIADFCARQDVQDKFTLHVIDGLEGCFDHGPKPGSAADLFRPNTIWFGFDPVALDALGAQAIEAQRKAKGLKPLQRVGRHPQHIELAAKGGLGVADLDKIDVDRLTLG